LTLGDENRVYTECRNLVSQPLCVKQYHQEHFPSVLGSRKNPTRVEKQTFEIVPIFPLDNEGYRALEEFLNRKAHENTGTEVPKNLVGDRDREKEQKNKNSKSPALEDPQKQLS